MDSRLWGKKSDRNHSWFQLIGCMVCMDHTRGYQPMECS